MDGRNHNVPVTWWLTFAGVWQALPQRQPIHGTQITISKFAINGNLMTDRAWLRFPRELLQELSPVAAISVFGDVNLITSAIKITPSDGLNRQELLLAAA